MISGFSSNAELVQSLIRDGYIKSQAVARAFLEVDRADFVWPGSEKLAYVDEPLVLGDTGQTISAPSMIAIMLEALELKRYEHVLEIGTGSGYSAALISRMVSPSSVITVELSYRLYLFARKNLERYSNVIPVLGDGSKGFPPYSKEELYDKAVIMAAAQKIPDELFAQIKKDGFVLAPVGGRGYQDLIKRWKNGREESYGGCVFVPLRSL